MTRDFRWPSRWPGEVMCFQSSLNCSRCSRCQPHGLFPADWAASSNVTSAGVCRPPCGGTHSCPAAACAAGLLDSTHHTILHQARGKRSVHAFEGHNLSHGSIPDLGPGKDHRPGIPHPHPVGVAPAGQGGGSPVSQIHIFQLACALQDTEQSWTLLMQCLGMLGWQGGRW